MNHTVWKGTEDTAIEKDRYESFHLLMEFMFLLSGEEERK